MVMTRAILNEVNQFRITLQSLFMQLVNFGGWCNFIKNVANLIHQIDILSLVSSADRVNFAWLALLKSQLYCLAMILHINPIPHIRTISIYRQKLARQRAQNHQRDYLLRILVRTIIIGTIEDNRWQSIRMVIGTYKMITCRLGGRVGGIRRIGCLFREIPLFT